MIATALAFAACSSTGSVGGSAEPVATSHVDLPKSYMFVPAVITVTSGATVSWSNSDNFTHSVLFTSGLASDSPASQNEGLVMKPGQSTSLAIAAAGTYQYKCYFHPQNMHGTIIVTG